MTRHFDDYRRAEEMEMYLEQAYQPDPPRRRRQPARRPAPSPRLSWWRRAIAVVNGVGTGLVWIALIILLTTIAIVFGAKWAWGLDLFWIGADLAAYQRQTFAAQTAEAQAPLTTAVPTQEPYPTRDPALSVPAGGAGGAPAVADPQAPAVPASGLGDAAPAPPVGEIAPKGEQLVAQPPAPPQPTSYVVPSGEGTRIGGGWEPAPTPEPAPTSEPARAPRPQINATLLGHRLYVIATAEPDPAGTRVGGGWGDEATEGGTP